MVYGDYGVFEATAAAIDGGGWLHTGDHLPREIEQRLPPMTPLTTTHHKAPVTGLRRGLDPRRHLYPNLEEAQYEG